jgi:hypothetical protein
MSMPKPKVYTKVSPPADGDLSNAGRRLLAEGDSWFTLGTLSLREGTNLLLELEFEKSNAIVSWAYPGDTLQQMAKGINDRDFDAALWNRTSRRTDSFWEAIILSAGGNDLIAAAGVPAAKRGVVVPPDRRLFLTAQEAGSADPLARISQAGFKTLTDYLLINLKDVLARKERGQSSRSPLFLHTYALPAPRPVGAGSSPRGWLFPAMERYQIPEGDMPAVCTELFQRLRAFLLSLDCMRNPGTGLPKVHVFDSAGVTIDPAVPGAPGKSGDWVNEIHLTAKGYRKLGPPFGQFIDSVVASYNL